MEAAVISGRPLLPICASGFGFGFSKSRQRRSNNNFRAVDRDSDFEIDPDKAREALRKLDQQLDLISQNQQNPPPRIKASSPYDSKEVPETGSFLQYLFFGLVIFTIVYNIVFIQVIKPSIDGPQEVSPSPEVSMSPIMNL